jgi:hypothetical protein
VELDEQGGVEEGYETGEGEAGEVVFTKCECEVTFVECEWEVIFSECEWEKIFSECE